MTCVQAKDLMLEAATGSVIPDRRRMLVSHLQICQRCRAEAASLDAAVHLLRAVPEPHLPAGFWEAFMAALERRLAAEARAGPRLRRWLRRPRVAWAAAAAAALATVAVLAVLQPFRPAPIADVPDPDAAVRGFVAPSVVRAMPAVRATLTSWKAGLGAADDPDEPPGGGR